MASFVKYEFVELTVCSSVLGISKSARHVTNGVIRPDKKEEFLQSCKQGINDEHEARVPVLAWTEIIQKGAMDYVEQVIITEVWAINSDDLSEFKEEYSTWLFNKEDIFFSTWWYKNLLYAHIEMYELSELFTNEAFIKLMGGKDA